MFNFTFMPPKTPETTEEVLNLLDPQKAQFDSPLTIFGKLDPSHKRALADLAGQVRDAKREDYAAAVNSLRAALLALGFGKDFVNDVAPMHRQASGKVKAKLPEGEKTRGSGFPMNRQYHESNCRFYTETESDPDNNQGSFVD